MLSTVIRCAMRRMHWAAKTRQGARGYISLICDALEGGVIIKSEVTSVNDVVCAGLLRQLIQRLQVACFTASISITMSTEL